MSHIPADWAQVITGAVSATATFCAVAVALWLPHQERRRTATEVGRVLLALSRYAIDFSGRLETALFHVDPEKERRELRLLLAVAELLALRQNTPAGFVAVYMLQLPEMKRIEASLDDWCEHIVTKKAFDSIPLRHDLQRLVPRLATLEEVKRFSDAPRAWKRRPAVSGASQS